MVEIKQKPRLHATWIEPDAAQIVEKLQKAGFISYLVGGCVRDLLAGIHPKDFDIVTSALPNEVRKKIWGSYVIGRRFRLVLAKRGDQQYEIATFRREGKPEDFIEGEEAPIGDNFFGTPEQDAIRRDFTINSMFYDPIKDELIDYAGGLKDIEARIVRMIGDPATRIKEDAIRSLRAVRLAHKLCFQIEPSFRAAIQECAEDVVKSVLPRRREEYIKLLKLSEPLLAFNELYDLTLMEKLLPSLARVWQNIEALENFRIYFEQARRLIPVDKDPLETFIPFIYAFERAWPESESLAEAKDQFMRIELGMFKAEIAELEYIFENSKKLPELASFKKRGHRRQSAFLGQTYLPHMLHVAELDFSLPASELEGWRALIDK
jgi:poly(A) polymerase